MNPLLWTPEFKLLRQLVAARGVEPQGFRPNECRKLLENLPGVDPVLAAADGAVSQLPPQGWVIDAKVTPGQQGIIRVRGYTEPPEVSGVSDSREKYGSMRAHFSLSPSGTYTIARERPGYPFRDTEPFDRTDLTYTGLPFGSTHLIDLEDGGRILAQKRPLQIGDGGLFFSMDWEDYRARDFSSVHSVPANRVTNDYDELKVIVAGLGAAMGLSGNDLEALLRTVTEKVDPNLAPPQSE
jgi:hypothetical protein